MAGSAIIQTVKRQMRQPGPIDLQIQRAIAAIADTDCPILISGERGVGKRTTATQIHGRSHRARGSFTEIPSADATANGLLAALSNKGTVYLSEIGDLSLDLQELIVEACVHPYEAVNGRLLFGTSRELNSEVRAGRMREDFYYFVSSITLKLSPLRCRKAEILLIADDLLTQYSKQFDRPKPVLQEEMIGFLMEHSWPENLVELQTAIKTFVAIGDQSVSLAALKVAASTARVNGNRKAPSLKEAARAASTQIERELIAQVLVATGGNRKRAADELGISYKALLYKLKQVEQDYQSASNKNGVSV